MNNQLTMEDIYKAAMQVEAVGKAFYKDYAAKSDSDELKKTFDFLAFKEERHYLKFQEMLEMVDLKATLSGISEENLAFITRMMKEKIFSDTKKAESLLKRVKSTREALEAALELENDSIRFYDAIAKGVDEKAAKEIKKIITEEEVHAETITNMMENLV